MSDAFSSDSISLFPCEHSVYGSCRSVSRFENKERIGEGAYGTVYRAKDRETKHVVALKRVILHNEKQDGFPLTSLREIALLKRISHPHCVALLDVVVGGQRDSVYLVFEYCENDLASLLETIKTPFTMSEIKSLMKQLLLALEYLHSSWIVHRDLKLSNLLYNNKGQLKLADFGLARLYGHPAEPLTPKVVTLWYRCPELLLGETVSGPPIDMWAAGCVFGELVIGKPLMPGSAEADQLNRIFELIGSPNSRIWPGLEELPLIRNSTITIPDCYRFSNLSSGRLEKLSECGIRFLNGLLTYDPDRRLTAKQSIDHEYFNESPTPKETELMPTFRAIHTQQLVAVGGQGHGLGQKRKKARVGR
ncbi:unnamed protein product [Chrysoparadoxa australica]